MIKLSGKIIKPSWKNEAPDVFENDIRVYHKSVGLIILMFFATPLLSLLIQIENKVLILIILGAFGLLFLLYTQTWGRFANNNILLYPESKVLEIRNRYYPFKKVRYFAFSEIKSITLLTGINRIKLHLHNGNQHLFFCECLQRDYYDEHFSSRTFDDLYCTLKRLDLPVDFPNADQ